MNKKTIAYLVAFFTFWVASIIMILSAFLYGYKPNIPLMHAVGITVIVMAVVPFLPKKYRKWLTL